MLPALRGRRAVGRVRGLLAASFGRGAAAGAGSTSGAGAGIGAGIGAGADAVIVAKDSSGVNGTAAGTDGAMREPAVSPADSCAAGPSMRGASMGVLPIASV